MRIDLYKEELAYDVKLKSGKTIKDPLKKVDKDGKVTDEGVLSIAVVHRGKIYVDNKEVATQRVHWMSLSCMEVRKDNFSKTELEKWFDNKETINRCEKRFRIEQDPKDKKKKYVYYWMQAGTHRNLTEGKKAKEDLTLKYGDTTVEIPKGQLIYGRNKFLARIKKALKQLKENGDLAKIMGGTTSSSGSSGGKASFTKKSGSSSKKSGSSGKKGDDETTKVIGKIKMDHGKALLIVSEGQGWEKDEKWIPKSQIVEDWDDTMDEQSFVIKSWVVGKN